ncbi:MAG: hypothetical protein QOJ65_2639 [Fimbriimonadaceae bacterium]|jgi:hypothetical protein|nr:hypothetical protein [Fimbriimonadaceae bacterium]
MLNNGLVAFVASLAGMMAGIGLSHMGHEDVLKGKRLELVDDQGKAWITADASGIVVLGEDEGSATQIRAQQKARITFQEEGEVRCDVGCNYKGSSGFGTYYGGRLRSYIASNEDKSIVGVFTGDELTDYMSLFDGTMDNKNAARLTAFDKGTTLTLSGKDGTTKSISNDTPAGATK